MSTPDSDTEYPWVARLREAGLRVRTGTGELAWEPDDSLTPPPWFRPGIRARIRGALRNAWKGGAGRLLRLTRSKRHATVP